jgi:F-type H+-transporting ATPase subunit epsilon
MGDPLTNMPATYGFQCTVITPERQVFDAAVDFVALPAHDGEIGILQNRAPLLCKLGIGILRILIGTETQRMFIDGGFAQMLENELTVLTARAATAEQVDPQAEEAALAAARNLRARDAEAERASAKLKLVR